MHCNNATARKRSKDLALLLSMLVLLGASLDTHASSFPRWENRRENEGSLRLLADVNFISAGGNYDAAGAQTSVNGLTSYTKKQIDLGVIYGASKSFTLYGRVSTASIEYDTTTTKGAASGLSEQALGANLRLFEFGTGFARDGSPLRTYALDLQAQFDIPFYKNTEARLGRQPILGDGISEFTVGPWLTLPLSQGRGMRWYAIGGLGYSSRGEGYSPTIPYGTQIAMLPETNGILLRAGIFGQKATVAEPQSAAGTVSTALVPTAATSDTGGSFIANALNSSLMAFRGSIGYQWGASSQVYATYQTTMSGISTAALNALVISLQLRFPGSPRLGVKAEDPNFNPGSRPGFVGYELEAKVKKANDRMNLVQIDKGEQDGVERGHYFDFYRMGADGRTLELIARGAATQVGPNESTISVQQYYKEVWIEEGFIAKRLVK